VDVSAINIRLARKLADPTAREALRDQQKGGVIQFYGELFKRWHLSGPAAQPVLDALADHELQQLASALSGANPGSDANVVGANAADNAVVRAVLNTKQLEDLRTYDSTLTDRMTLGPFLGELDLAQTPLSADRVEQLVNIIHDERLAVPQPSPPSATEPAGAYAQALDEWQTALDERVRDRAALILPAGVLSRLETFQNGQRAAAAIFAPTEPENAQTAAATASGDSQSGPPTQQ